MVSIPVGSQNSPVEYLTRRFSINYNLPKMGAIVKPNSQFPALTEKSAMALAALALLKLRVAENGVAQQATTEWNAELAAAKTFADAALAAVSQMQQGAGFFPTPARVGAALTRYALRKGNASGKWSAPGSYDADAFTHADTAPSAAALTPSIANSSAIDINLISGATDAEGDPITVLTVGGKNFVVGQTITVNDSHGTPVVLTMAAPFHLTGNTPVATGSIGPIVAVLTDGRGGTINRNVTITVT